MRYRVIIFLAACVVFACVKPKTKDPVPVIGFNSVQNLQKMPASGSLPARDTAVLVIDYQDGDGDIFRNATTDGPNFFYTVYTFNEDSGKLVIDGITNPMVVKQPADGYYRDKSIQGQIYIPLSQFRSSNKIKTIKFETFMVDMKSHRSNTVSSPVYTISF